MSQINKNILANILGRGWSILSVFIFIPVYIEILGPKMYGVISFYAILQGILIFADAGLTATLRRELAKGDFSLEKKEYKYKVFKSIEFSYIIIVLFIVSLVWVLSAFFVNSWLNIEDLNTSSTVLSIKIMGLALGLNFLASLYQGGLLGLEKQVLSNVLQIIWGLLKNGAVILVILYFEKSLIFFFAWSAIVNIIYVLVLRGYLSKFLKANKSFRWDLTKDLKILLKHKNYTLGMFLISIIASINTQFDKIVLSKLLTVSELSIYNVAYSLSMIPIIIAGPISIAIFPRFVKFFDSKNQHKLKLTFNNSFKLVVILSGSLALVLSLYSELFINIWTQNNDLSAKASLPASILIIGQAFLAFQVIPFNLALANGNTKINIKMGFLGFFILIPLVIFLTSNYGMLGASFAWLIYTVIITPIFVYNVIKKLTNFEIYKWLLINTFKPVILMLFFNITSYFLIRISNIQSNYILLLFIIIASSISIIITFKLVYNLKFHQIPKFIKNELFT